VATIIISDFRGKQLQHNANKLAGYAFLSEDTAEYSWFNDCIATQLHNCASAANVVIMLGFNDCVYSCLWDTCNIDKIATSYVSAINKLVEEYPSLHFYICSVNPIDGPYQLTGELNTIQACDLTEKINAFNIAINGQSLKAGFIDSYKYLMSVGFTTRDGIRYAQESCESLFSYINYNIENYTNVAPFSARTTKPQVDSDDFESDRYWINSKFTDFGYNPFGTPNVYFASSYDTLPNDTAYAWGRFYEILGVAPKLCQEAANKWFDYNDGYTRGQEPVVGAIMCFTGGTYKGMDGSNGHVAVVESIYADGSIETSESAWEDSRYWWTKKRKMNNGSWNTVEDGLFQGFIYCPSSISVDKESLCTKNSYDIDREEMKPNAQYIWQYLGARGWTKKAVAGLLGNIEQESNLSPCVWQNPSANKDCETIDNATGIHTLTEKGRNFTKGYGLVQWTPASKYFNWCENGGKSGNANGSGGVLPYWDIDTQLRRIINELEVEKKDWIEGLSQWIPAPKKGYNLSFAEFIKSEATPRWLAGAFAFCYERPGRSTGTPDEQEALRKERGDNAEFWYSFLNTITLGVSDEKVYIDDFKVTKYADNLTTATISFLQYNCAKASYRILQDKHEGDEYSINISDTFVTFDVSNLIPNKNYTVELTAVSGNDEKVVKKLTFTTPQSYPKSVKKIELELADNKLHNNKVKLTTEPISDWGHWKKNDHGYILQLIVNGKVKSEKVLSSIGKTSIFKLDAYFENYEAKLGDTIQIGIRTWVLDDNGNKIFDSQYVKTSNSVCFLTRPIQMYLKAN
jgi:hypothetical protein